MTAFIGTNVLIYAQGAGPKSETPRRVVLAGALPRAHRLQLAHPAVALCQ